MAEEEAEYVEEEVAAEEGAAETGAEAGAEAGADDAAAEEVDEVSPASSHARTGIWGEGSGEEGRPRAIGPAACARAVGCRADCAVLCWLLCPPRAPPHTHLLLGGQELETMKQRLKEMEDEGNYGDAGAAAPAEAAKPDAGERAGGWGERSAHSHKTPNDGGGGTVAEADGKVMA